MPECSGTTESAWDRWIQKRILNVSDCSMAELVLITHEVAEQDVQDALAVIAGLSVVASVENVIRVEGGGRDS